MSARLPATARLNIIDCDGFGLSNYFEGRCRTGQYQNRDCIYVNTLTGEKIILVSGGGKRGDQRYIKGNTYGMAYVTEANECALDFLREVFDRTLSSKDRKVFHDLNPKSESHWYYTDILDFHEKKQAADSGYGYNYGHFTIADNMSVSDDQLKAAINTYDPGTVWYMRDILGMRKQVEGLVYPMFDRLRHVFTDKDAPKSGEWFISIDYGIQNPFSAGLWCVSSGVAYRMAEYYYDGRANGQRTDEEHADRVMALAVKRFIRKYVIDPSAASFIACMRKRVQWQSIVPANNEVIPGISNVASALKQNRIRIHETCKDLIREMGIYSWDDKSAEDRPVKENDHAADEARYFIRTILRKMIPLIDSEKRRSYEHKRGCEYLK